MATTSANPKLSGLSRRLVQDGLLDEAGALAAQDDAQKKRIPLVAYLVESKKVDAKAVASASSLEFGIPAFDVTCLDHEAVPKDLISEKLVRKHHALPLIKRGNRLFV
ncbi:MAG TPA: type IV-A pilus assembly ATPase PilB, partial [Thioalkalivibrio sp.]|nr:type IV-A pilus assembly ATPase PilB [Thioalkalivibrio sp.]